ncbi:hypothetical protein D3C86_1992880 [compost metagenome]
MNGQANGDRTFFSELQGIADHIQKNLLNANRIRVIGDRDVFGKVELQINALVFGFQIQRAFHIIQQFHKREI